MKVQGMSVPMCSDAEESLSDRKRRSFGSRLREGASLDEGVSGLVSMQTRFENIQEEHLDLVSSDFTGYEDDPAAARDLARCEYPERW